MSERRKNEKDDNDNIKQNQRIKWSEDEFGKKKGSAEGSLNLYSKLYIFSARIVTRRINM